MVADSIDSLFDGRITVRQAKDGYRFAVDAVLLAGHARPGVNDTVVDIGTGCGVIPLILSHRYPDIRIFGVELQRDLAELAGHNVRDNRLTDRITILNQDMVSLTRRQLGRPIQLVISNPPYREACSSRLNPNRQRALARHELAVTLSDVIATAVRVLEPSGRFICIFPAERLTDLVSLMRTAVLSPGFAGRSIRNRIQMPNWFSWRVLKAAGRGSPLPHRFWSWMPRVITPKRWRPCFGNKENGIMNSRPLNLLIHFSHYFKDH